MPINPKKKYTCPECGKKIKTEDGLKQHTKAKHSAIWNNGCNKESQSEKAIKDPQKVKKNSKSSDPLILAKKYYNKGNFKGSMEEYLKALAIVRKKKDKSFILGNLGKIYEKLGDLKGEIESFETLNKLNPNDAKISEKLADLYANTRDYPKAISTYKKTLQYAPNKEIILTKLRMLYFKTESIKEAIKTTSHLTNIGSNRGYNRAKLKFQL